MDYLKQADTGECKVREIFKTKIISKFYIENLRDILPTGKKVHHLFLGIKWQIMFI
jgi:hypothetical protein